MHHLDSRAPSRRASVDLRQQTLLSSASRRSSCSPVKPSVATDPFTAFAINQDWHHNPVFMPSASLLNSRRPSYASLPEPPVRRLYSQRSRSSLAGGRGNPVRTQEPSDDDGQDGDGEGELGTDDDAEDAEDGGNFRKSLQIDMKGLFGDAVGNMSISPSSRDLVLAARRGLFIIDLEAPLEIPRFLPQGGTWDVADVQWNPHPSRAEYIVSTSSEKMLIWNLLLVGKTSIEHILQAHYRAITDINWHTTECDTVISIGIDSWLWAWDLREPRKPIFGLSPFEATGTQVKWNRNDPNILASSHGNVVLIWDRRKGSLPITRIEAHTSKIYGIDWAHDSRSEIVTCSLDKTIKFWDIEDLESSSSVMQEPTTKIQTSYPVWRARNLPFGRDGGVLSLAQRGETALEMWAQGHPEVPVERFEGHADVVKEFVWRKGVEDEFQLITWSKDRTLRFWPVVEEVMRSVGHRTADHESAQFFLEGDDDPMSDHLGERHRRRREGALREPTISFRNPPEGTEYLPALSAPIGHRSILAEVRAGAPPRLAIQQVHEGRPGRSRAGSGTGRGGYGGVGGREGSERSVKDTVGHVSTRSHGNAVEGGSGSGGKGKAFLNSARSRGETMSRGNVNGGTGGVGNMDAFTWLSKVKVGGRGGGYLGSGNGGLSHGMVGEVGGGAGEGRAASSGPPTPGEESGSLSSRHNSRSRQVGGADLVGMEERWRESESRVRGRGDEREREVERRESLESGMGQAQSLQDEITSVLTKLATPKIKLEKHDLTKRRTCTFGLHGPWGESSLVFIRVTFTFPRNYPQATYPDGIPIIDLERNPLISLKDRAFMLRRLTAIREHRRPCLESCLRFLLFRDEEERMPGEPLRMMDQGESSSSDEGDDDGLMRNAKGIGGTGGGGAAKKTRDGTGILRGNKNLVEPRTSQGTFGPNGELVCFFRDPTRIVRNVLRGLSDSPKTPSEEPPQPPTTTGATETPPRMFQSPSLISDAVRRLGMCAKDRPLNSKLTENHRKLIGDRSNILRIMTNLLTFSQHKSDIGTGEVKPLGDILKSYALLAPRRSTVFIENTTNLAGGDKKVAVDYVFEVREGSLADVCEENAGAARRHGRMDHERAFRTLQAVVVGHEKKTGVADCEGVGDLGMKVVMALYSDFEKNKDLQMLAMLSSLLLQLPFPDEPPATQYAPIDYFSLQKNARDHPSPSVAWPRRPSSGSNSSQQLGASLPSSAASSRASWSSLFGTNTMRQFMSGVQDTLKEGLSTPESTPLPILENPIPLPPATAPKSNTPTPEPSFSSGMESGIGARRGKREVPRKESSQNTPTLTLTAPPSSWNEMVPRPLRLSTSSSVTGQRRSPLKTITDPGNHNRGRNGHNRNNAKRVVVFDPPSKPTKSDRPSCDMALLRQFAAHVHTYGDLLDRWQLYHKRLELLKSVKRRTIAPGNLELHGIGLFRTCKRCTAVLPDKAFICSSCNATNSMAKCSICRLPVKGLLRSCLYCFHVTHISCWSSLNVPICPTGCGCICNGLEEMQTRPPSRHGLSPRPAPLLLPFA